MRISVGGKGKLCLALSLGLSVVGDVGRILAAGSVFPDLIYEDEREGERKEEIVR